MCRVKRLFCLALGLIGTFAACAEDAYDLVLISFESKPQAVKAVHDISGMSIKDSKALVEALPKAFLTGVSRETAQKAQVHAEALKCKVEIRAADPKAALHKFDLVIAKVDPASKAAAAIALNGVLPKEQRITGNAEKLLDSAPVTVLVGQTPLEIETNSRALTTAGCTVEAVSTGGVETGGYSVVLTKIEPLSKIRTISTIREHTGLGLATATAIVEKLPAAVKIKLPKEEAEKIKVALEADKATTEIKETGK